MARPGVFEDGEGVVGQAVLDGVVSHPALHPGRPAPESHHQVDVVTGELEEGAPLGARPVRSSLDLEVLVDRSAQQIDVTQPSLAGGVESGVQAIVKAPDVAHLEQQLFRLASSTSLRKGSISDPGGFSRCRCLFASMTLRPQGMASQNLHSTTISWMEGSPRSSSLGDPTQSRVARVLLHLGESRRVRLAHRQDLEVRRRLEGLELPLEVAVLGAQHPHTDLSVGPGGGRRQSAERPCRGQEVPAVHLLHRLPPRAGRLRPRSRNRQEVCQSPRVVEAMPRGPR